MTGKLVLDTSVIIAALRRAPGVWERLRAADALLVPLVALGELEYGANLAQHAAKQRAAINAFMTGVELLMPSARTAVEYGRIKAELSRGGTLIPENDIWIAAYALEGDLPLATRDAHFARVPGLTVQDWR